MHSWSNEASAAGNFYRKSNREIHNHRTKESCMPALFCYGLRRLSWLPEGTAGCAHKTNGCSHHPWRSGKVVVVEQKISFRHKISPILSSQIEGREKKLATIFLFFHFCPELVGGCFLLHGCSAVSVTFPVITTGWGEGRFKWWGTMLHKRIYVHIYTWAISIYRSHT